MSNHRSSRSVDSNDVKENLYETGLLSRPHTGPAPLKNPSISSERYYTPKSTPPRIDPRLHSTIHTSFSQSYKKSSISAGTLAKPRATIESELRRHEVGSRPTTKAIAFSPSEYRPQKTVSKMPATISNERTKSRKDRTFVGGECAACEEPLEHTLRGERVLQFSCGHIAHEACFYEYIQDTDAQHCPICDAPLGLDSNRGGSILDLNKLSNMVRAIAQHPDTVPPRELSATPLPWDRSTTRDETVGMRETPSRLSLRDNPNRDSRDSQRMRIERLGFVNQHSRNNSNNDISAESSSQGTIQTGRKHDYDLHAMETTVTEPRFKDRQDFIPAPMVTVRSEFPTLVRSPQQQSLTCLVTVEVPEKKFRLHHDRQQFMPVVTRMYSTPAPSVVARPAQMPVHKPFEPIESAEVLEDIAQDLKSRVDNWHGLDLNRFGALRLHGNLRVGKDLKSWQELECYLFGEMLICVKEKKSAQVNLNSDSGRKLTRCTLKGSILIKKHLKEVQSVPEDLLLTLNLSVPELPTFHLRFQNHSQIDLWTRALYEVHPTGPLTTSFSEYEPDTSGTDDDDYGGRTGPMQVDSFAASSIGGSKSATTAATEYSLQKVYTDHRMPPSMHIPLDIVVVIPVSSSMQGLKINLLKDTLRFLVSNLGERDRMGLVTFGSSQGGVPLVGMTTKKWSGWNSVLSSIKPVGQKSLRADVVDGANVAMDLLMQRKATNPVSTILLISDSSTSETESVDFVVQRAEAAKVGIYSFGLGLTHKPDSMLELSTRTKASYIYVKDWMLLRECAAGCLGSLQSTSQRDVKLKLKLPEGSPARFVKISGALQTSKRSTGREAEASLGDLRFGDRRDILVQLAIDPDAYSQDQAPQDHWESIVSGLEALGGAVESDDQRVQSIEEVPLLQADLSFSDLQSDGAVSQLSRPSLLTITMLPVVRKSKLGRPATPSIPPHPSIVQRRMELLTSDMLTRALTLVSRGQNDRAQHLLTETRTILKGLGKGGLPPLPSSAGSGVSKAATHPHLKNSSSPRAETPDRRRDHSPDSDGGTPVPRNSTVDQSIMLALDADIESSLEWINHPAVFSRDTRKAVLQNIGTIATQRAYTFRTASEYMWAERIAGVKHLTEESREWREINDDPLTEEQ